MRRFEILPHTADIAVAVYGEDVGSLFANAGTALFELMFDMRVASSGPSVRVEVEGEGIEELLVAWLAELLAIFEVERVALHEFSVELVGERSAAGSAAVTPVDELTLTGALIKAVTYHDLEVRRVGDLWAARIVLDV